MLLMTNAVPNKNGSQYFITTAVTLLKNDMHVVFGAVL